MFYLSLSTKGGLDQFQFSALSTLHSSDSDPSEDDMVKIGRILELNLTQLKLFLRSHKSKKLERKATPLISSDLTGYYM